MLAWAGELNYDTITQTQRGLLLKCFSILYLDFDELGFGFEINKSFILQTQMKNSKIFGFFLFS